MIVNRLLRLFSTALSTEMGSDSEMDFAFLLLCWMRHFVLQSEIQERGSRTSILHLQLLGQLLVPRIQTMLLAFE